MKIKSRIILAIETSCDETAASIIKDGEIKSNIIFTQDIHSKFGGVFPELASREHIKKIIFCIDRAFLESNTKKKDLSAVAYTKGPGLLGSLLVGMTFAKSLAYSLDIPTISVNHLMGHIYSNFIKKEPIFPFVSIIVSGGHTIIVLLKSEFDMEILGQTLDDAIGEAFDKIAKIMNLPYPGGPIIDELSKIGNEERFQFPNTNVPDLNMSFSGIKTAFINFINNSKKQDSKFIQKNINDICASIQKKLIDMLEEKILLVLKKKSITNLAFCGGVAANSYLNKRAMILKKKYNLNVFFPEKEYCTDNAAMIAKVADIYYKNKIFSNINDEPNPRMKLKE